MSHTDPIAPPPPEHDAADTSGPLDRRQFLRLTGAAAAALGASSAALGQPVPASAQVRTPTPRPTPRSSYVPAPSQTRLQKAYQIRMQAAQMEMAMGAATQQPNGDETLYPNRIGNYSKGLPHNDLGEVDAAAYTAFLKAAQSGKPADWAAIPMGGTLQLKNPQGGLPFTMQGADAACFAQPPAPRFASAEIAAEIAENYWMALLRDVPFEDYATDPMADAAATSLSAFSNLKAPKSGGQVTPGTLFRGVEPGCTVGPYVSQFMWLDTPFGAEPISRRMRTTTPGVDFMTAYPEWLAIQRGIAPSSPQTYDPVPRYIRNGRDLGEWVHIDVLFQAYFNAMLILFSLGAPMDDGNPYKVPSNQCGFGSFGPPYIASVLCAVARHALQTVWHQKWFVHRRLRPEAFAGRIHNHVTGAASYPLHAEILGSDVLDAVFGTHGSYLLPMAFAEGCPAHPAYGAGHATVAGACVTVLKAMFDESWVIPNPVVANADGTALVPYTGPALTVGGELNKVASNVAIGRNIAGVHWRSDATESLKLGEAVAIRYLMEEKMLMNEAFGGYSLTKFDGTTVTV
ncbi:phosphoesterase [bacterium]|nr:twin-arginine translocation signal domain-containing protein [Chloroflexi bacterium CFX6]RIL07457.1 MAG: phosphoesterase [bacterium]